MITWKIIKAACAAEGVAIVYNGKLTDTPYIYPQTKERVKRYLKTLV